MSSITQRRMTVDEYFAWADRRSGRYELVDGAVFEMSPETAGHAKIKAAIYVALMTAIRRRGLPCHALPDGMTVRIDAATAFQPDAIVYCGPEIDAASIEVPDPVIVVEVLSPSTRQVDLSVKLAGYFRVPSVVHYLIVDPGQPLILHYARSTGDALLTRIVRNGEITFDPPGMEISMTDDVYEAASG